MQTFTVPPERYIAAPTWEVFEHCRGLLKGQHDEKLMSEVSQLVEGTSQFEFQALRRRIKRNFQTFALAAQGKRPPGKAATARPSEEQLDKEELRFMNDMVDLLEACHFRLLSADDWATAQAEEFTFTMPVEVNWQYMDKSLMNAFWAGQKDQRPDKASMADRILVFTRGVTSMKAKGMFVTDKIDMLVSYLIVQPLTTAWERFAPASLQAAAPRLTVDVNEHMEASDIKGHSGRTSEPAADIPSASSLSHQHAKDVRRVTLKALMPNSTAVVKRLFETLTLEEPGFKNLIILYRRNEDSAAAKPKNEKAPIRDCDASLAKRNIHIKRFDDIPMADAEMCFPDKRVYVKPLTLITLFVTIVLGLIACVSTAFSREFSLGTFCTVLGIFGGRAYQVYYSATIARQQVVDQIMEALYEQTMDAQEGVLYFLLEEMSEQHIKEVMVAYFTLLCSGMRMSREQLDQKCEQDLARHFGQEVDFAVERALPELLHDGLIRDEGGVLSAVPLDEAHRMLKAKWANAYQLQHQTQQLAVAGHAEHDQGTNPNPTPAPQTSERDHLKRLSEHARSSFQSRSPGQPQLAGLQAQRPSHVQGAPLDSLPSRPGVQQESGAGSGHKGVGSSILGLFKPGHKQSKKRE